MEARSCKTILFAFALAVSAIETRAQNLVPNPSFETTTACPTDQDQLSYATPWVKPTGNTPDYYNACTNSIMHVPENWYGTESAHTGDAYAGFYSYYGGNSREYIEAPLVNALEAGKRYCVSFYVSLADSCLDGISPIGAYFSSTLYNDQGFIENLDVTPQVSSPLEVTLADTSGWTLISGSFIATGGERYMIIGTFAPDSLLTIDSTIRPRPNNYAKFAYYYIDDVSVIEIADCMAGVNMTINANDSLELGTIPVLGASYSWMPQLGLSDPFAANPKASPSTTTTYTLTQTQCEVTATSAVTVTVNPTKIFIPNPVWITEQLKVIGLEPNSTLEIFDMQGRAMYTGVNYQNDFWMHELSVGVYIVNLTRPNGEVLQQKLCVVK